jgi:hypothetical protein
LDALEMKFPGKPDGEIICTSKKQAEALWAEEAERRLDEIEHGQVNEVPAQEVLRRARAVIL